MLSAWLLTSSPHPFGCLWVVVHVEIFRATVHVVEQRLDGRLVNHGRNVQVVKQEGSPDAAATPAAAAAAATCEMVSSVWMAAALSRMGCLSF
jgi:hypothetical protein